VELPPEAAEAAVETVALLEQPEAPEAQAS
jgi:hypothetical protein